MEEKIKKKAQPVCQYGLTKDKTKCLEPCLVGDLKYPRTKEGQCPPEFEDDQTYIYSKAGDATSLADIKTELTTLLPTKLGADWGVESLEQVDARVAEMAEAIKTLRSKLQKQKNDKASKAIAAVRKKTNAPEGPAPVAEGPAPVAEGPVINAKTALEARKEHRGQALINYWKKHTKRTAPYREEQDKQLKTALEARKEHRGQALTKYWAKRTKRIELYREEQLKYNDKQLRLQTLNEKVDAVQGGEYTAEKHLEILNVQEKYATKVSPACTNKNFKQLNKNQESVYVLAKLRQMGKITTPGLLVKHSTGSGKTLIGVLIMISFWDATYQEAGVTKMWAILSVSTISNQKDDNNIDKLANYFIDYFGFLPVHYYDGQYNEEPEAIFSNTYYAAQQTAGLTHKEFVVQHIRDRLYQGLKDSFVRTVDSVETEVQHEGESDGAFKARKASIKEVIAKYKHRRLDPSDTPLTTYGALGLDFGQNFWPADRAKFQAESTRVKVALMKEAIGDDNKLIQRNVALFMKNVNVDGDNLTYKLDTLLHDMQTSYNDKFRALFVDMEPETKYKKQLKGTGEFTAAEKDYIELCFLDQLHKKNVLVEFYKTHVIKVAEPSGKKTKPPVNETVFDLDKEGNRIRTDGQTRSSTRVFSINPNPTLEIIDERDEDDEEEQAPDDTKVDMFNEEGVYLNMNARRQMEHCVFILDEMQFLLNVPPKEASRRIQYSQLVYALKYYRNPENTWVVGLTATPGSTKNEVVDIMNMITGNPDTYVDVARCLHLELAHVTTRPIELQTANGVAQKTFLKVIPGKATVDKKVYEVPDAAAFPPHLIRLRMEPLYTNENAVDRLAQTNCIVSYADLSTDYSKFPELSIERICVPHEKGYSDSVIAQAEILKQAVVDFNREGNDPNLQYVSERGRKMVAAFKEQNAFDGVVYITNGVDVKMIRNGDKIPAKYVVTQLSRLPKGKIMQRMRKCTLYLEEAVDKKKGGARPTRAPKPRQPDAYDRGIAEEMAAGLVMRDDPAERAERPIDAFPELTLTSKNNASNVVLSAKLKQFILNLLKGVGIHVLKEEESAGFEEEVGSDDKEVDPTLVVDGQRVKIRKNYAESADSSQNDPAPEESSASASSGDGSTRGGAAPTLVPCKHYVYSFDRLSVLIIGHYLTTLSKGALQPYKGETYNEVLAKSKEGVRFYYFRDDVTSLRAPLNDIGPKLTKQQREVGFKIASAKFKASSFGGSDDYVNLYGELIPIVLATGESFKGVDMAAISHIHLLGSFTDMQDFIQLAGRGPRMCSHAMFETAAQRRVKMMVYTASLSNTKTNYDAYDADIFLYNKSVADYKGFWTKFNEVFESVAIDKLVFQDVHRDLNARIELMLNLHCKIEVVPVKNSAKLKSLLMDIFKPPYAVQSIDVLKIGGYDVTVRSKDINYPKLLFRCKMPIEQGSVEMLHYLAAFAAAGDKAAFDAQYTAFKAYKPLHTSLELQKNECATRGADWGLHEILLNRRRGTRCVERYDPTCRKWILAPDGKITCAVEPTQADKLEKMQKKCRENGPTYSVQNIQVDEAEAALTCVNNYADSCKKWTKKNKDRKVRCKLQSPVLQVLQAPKTKKNRLDKLRDKIHDLHAAFPALPAVRDALPEPLMEVRAEAPVLQVLQAPKTKKNRLDKLRDKIHDLHAAFPALAVGAALPEPEAPIPVREKSWDGSSSPIRAPIPVREKSWDGSSSPIRAPIPVREKSWDGSRSPIRAPIKPRSEDAKLKTKKNACAKKKGWKWEDNNIIAQWYSGKDPDQVPYPACIPSDLKCANGLKVNGRNQVVCATPCPKTGCNPKNSKEDANERARQSRCVKKDPTVWKWTTVVGIDKPGCINSKTTKDCTKWKMNGRNQIVCDTQVRTRKKAAPKGARVSPARVSPARVSPARVSPLRDASPANI